MSDVHAGGPPAAEPMQFEKAEFATGRPGRSCARCATPIADAYFEVDGAVTCSSCATALGVASDGRVSAPSSAGRGRRVMRALLFGGLGAVAGAAVWMAVTHVTGFAIGFVAIFVGILVGYGVKKGSDGRGGWLYQTMAVVLTYVAVVTTYVPDVYREIEKQSAEVAAGETAGDASSTELHREPSSSLAHVVVLGVAAFVFSFFVPFLAGFEHVVTLLILGFALFQAWKMNKRHVLAVAGPFRVAADVPPPMPALATASEDASR